MTEKDLVPKNNKIHEEIRELFSRFADEWPDLAPLNENGFVPHVDVIDREDTYVVKADIPGMDAKDIIVTLEKNVLTIEGDKQNDAQMNSDKNYLKSEISYGRFHREINLANDVKEDQAVATYRDGVLQITLMKNHGGVSKKRIFIEVNGRKQ